MNPIGELREFVVAALVRPVPRDHEESPARRRRRRVVVAVALAFGALLLGRALAVYPGDPLFYPATLGLAGVWITGAFASGPLHLGRAHTRGGSVDGRAVLQGLILGGVLLAVFCAGALVVGRVPALRAPVEGLLDHAKYGSLGVVALITAVNGVAEELFFRGAAYAALPRRWNLLGSAALYALATVLSGVPLLTFAAACLGLLTGAQRRVTGGVLGPIVSHLTWSLGMLVLLPPALSL
ncbi:MAG: CPBP family intramembrane glutamic endopeptidase [Dermatophilaceae bacterium]